MESTHIQGKDSLLKIGEKMGIFVLPIRGPFYVDL